jgi:SAM-dependent methyltransferase
MNRCAGMSRCAGKVNRMPKIWDRILLLPKLARLSSRAPRDENTAWEKYWNGIRKTGFQGEVLWDSGSAAELQRYEEHLRPHLDLSLPVVDIGCGNGSFTRWLGTVFPQALGVDVSASAIGRAQAEATAEGAANVRFMVLDATLPGADRELLEQLGPANVFVRGVLHVLKHPARQALAANIGRVTGDRGRVFLAETNFQGNGLDYVEHLGATPKHIPAPLQRAIEGLPMPGHFGPVERAKAFPEDRWQVLEEGPTFIEAVPMRTAGVREQIPGYFAVLARR